MIDPHHRTEAILHARAYTPAEAAARHFVHELCPPDAVLSRARALAAPLRAFDRKGYAITKRRQRAAAVCWAEQVLADEMVGLPVSAPRP